LLSPVIVGASIVAAQQSVGATRTTQTQTQTAAADPLVDANAGERAFNRVCAVCHGPRGRGDAAPALLPFDRSLLEVTAIVRDGRGEMPPVSGRTLSDQELGHIVEYLRSLSGR
jgi:mono/diheme cytochrome c family protein